VTVATLRVLKRQPLADMIPLAAPWMIRVDPSNACNFKCVYCPTGHEDLISGRPRGVMKMETFARVMAGVREMGIKKVYLYKDGEPLVNKRLPEMVALAKASGAEVWTTTNGALLEPGINQRLVDAGLDLMKISVQAVTDAGYLKIAGVRQSYEELRANVADLYGRRRQLRVHVKIVDAGLTADERAQFVADWSDRADSVHIDALMGWSVSDAFDFTLGTGPQAGPNDEPLVNRRVCPLPFYILSVNFDGSVSVCCVDWSHATIVGDVRTQTLGEIWRGDALREFRRMHLDGRRGEHKACGNCQYIKTLADNLDDRAAEIGSRLAPKI